MKKREIEKIFRKLDLKVRTTGHNYGWLVLDGKKILRGAKQACPSESRGSNLFFKCRTSVSPVIIKQKCKINVEVQFIEPVIKQYAET